MDLPQGPSKPSPKRTHIHLFLFLGGWTTVCVCTQPPCCRVGQKDGVPTTVKGAYPSHSIPGTPALRHHHNGHPRLMSRPEQHPQPPQPPPMTTPTPCHDTTPTLVDWGRNTGAATGERLQRWAPGHNTKRYANTTSTRDYRPKAAIR
jgi:hypothetical protein